jgi:membrane protease YdiL (CAAX protease family)
MAKSAKHRAWRPRMTRGELYRGWVFFALYFLVFPFLMAGVQWFFDEKWGLYLPVASANVVYYSFSAVLVLLVFWSFLRHGFFLLLDFLPENLFAIFSGFLGWFVLHYLAGFVPLPVTNPAIADYAQQFMLYPGATTAIFVLLMPLAEEVLFRGLLFGSLRRYSRAIAYLASILLSALYGVWQYAFVSGDLHYLLLAVLYLPAGLAFTWSYDSGGSVWSAIFLHMAVNAFTLRSIV